MKVGQVKAGLSVLAALAVAAFVSGCGSGQPKQRIVLQPVEVALMPEGPKVIDKGITGATLNFPFKVTNPNSVPVMLERLNLNATINDKELGSNVASPGVTIGANETVEVPVKYDVSFIGGGLAIVEAIASQSAQVAVDGTSKISNASNQFEADPLEHPFQIK